MNHNKSNHIRSLVFGEMGKPEYPGEQPHPSGVENQTQPTYAVEDKVEPRPRNIGERRVLLPLSHCANSAL